MILAGKFFQKKGFFSILTGNLANPLWKPCFEVQKDNFQFSFEAAMDKKPLVCDNNLSLN